MSKDKVVRIYQGNKWGHLSWIAEIVDTPFSGSSPYIEESVGNLALAQQELFGGVYLNHISGSFSNTEYKNLREKIMILKDGVNYIGVINKGCAVDIKRFGKENISYIIGHMILENRDIFEGVKINVESMDKGKGNNTILAT